MPPWVWVSASSEGYLICSPSPSSSCRCPLSQTREWSLGSLHQPEKHWLFRGPYVEIFKPLVISVAICWTFSSGSVSFESLELDLWASDSLIIAMPEEILYLIYLTLIPILLFATGLCAGSSPWFGFHHSSETTLGHCPPTPGSRHCATLDRVASFSICF